MKKIISFIIIAMLCQTLYAQHRNNHSRVDEDSDTTEYVCTHGSFDLGANNCGLSFGNSTDWNGLRFNFSDCGIRRISGINITFWKPGENPNSVVSGLSIGVAPGAGTLRGFNLGIAAVVAEDEIEGLNLGGLAIVSNGNATGINYGGLAAVTNGSLKGINFGGLAAVANNDITGLNIGGLATVSNRDIQGLTFGGLATVSNKDISGATFGGLATVSNGSLYGVTFGGVAAVANGEISGITFGGLAVVSNKDISGITLGGLAIVANGSVSGVNIGGLAVVANESITGLSIALAANIGKASISGFTISGYKTEAESFEGLNIAAGWSDIYELTGISIATYNRISGVQTGLVIGLFNSADELHGVQVGLLNIAKNNGGIAKVLPLINAHFD